MANRIIDYISGIEIPATIEEIEATQVFSKILVEDYQYPKSHIHTRPQFRVKVRPSDKKKEYPVDIAVFTSETHNDDDLYIVVECKKKSRKDGITQLKDYLRLSRASLGVWFNGNETLYLRKFEVKGRIEFREIPNIPLFSQRVNDIGLFKRRDLQNTHNLKPIFKNIRNYLAANNTGKTLDIEFVPQLINMIFCKIYDERFTKPNDMVSFRIGIDEDEKEVNKRVQSLFSQVKDKYPDVFEEADKISLSPNSIIYIVGELQQYCLIDSERDVISDAFETFIFPSLRGGQGQFFTPRNVVKLLLSIVNPNEKDRIIDPACGSGGFLVEAIRHVWRRIDELGMKLEWPENEIQAEKQNIAIRNFRGIDKENFLSKTTKAYMAILGDGRGGIFCENSLENTNNWSTEAKNDVQDNSFDVVLTNPPYGAKLKIDDTTILSLYSLGHRWEKNKNSDAQKNTSSLLDAQTPQVLFIEKCLKLLKEGGRLGIVAPESMFCNPSHKYIMNFVEHYARIDTIISMPEELFQPNTHAKTCLVMMTKYGRKVRKNCDYKIFMAVAKRCGHDSRGLEIPFDDLPLIGERFKKYTEDGTIDYDHLGFTVMKSEIIDNIFLPIYYNPEIKRRLMGLRKHYNLVTFGDLVNDGLISVAIGGEVGKLSYGSGQIPFIRTSDIANWEIKLDPKQGVSEAIYEANKDKQDVRPLDILMVKDGTYLVGTCAMISENETKMVYQSHLYKIRSNDHNKVNPWLLLALLTSPVVKQQIRAKQFTQDIIDTLGRRIHELVLPFPKNMAKKDEIINNVRSVFSRRKEAKEIMRNTLLGITPVHNFNEDGNFLTLV
ncbi:MAG: N-6 DNA methylase [Deltaproteobacteria bacterium]|nr:N-6 DNA methylase [Deltaproteobacteria bacterium]